MRISRVNPSGARAALLALAMATAAGCASAPGGGGGGGFRPAAALVAHLPTGSPLRSTTLAESDMWVRHYAVSGQRDSLALILAEGSRVGPRDDLHRSLQQALTLHESGEYAASNDLFELAEIEADRRYSLSVTQAATAIIAGDGAMDYTPSRAEIAMIPYYRMNNYLRLGDVDGAMVEARKASAYMAQLESATGDECRSNIFLKYLTGLVYELGGEMNDAVVALRQAEQGYDECGETYGIQPPASFGADLSRVASGAGLGDVADAARSRYGVASGTSDAGAGEVVLLVENGFVAHRSEQNIYFPIFDGDVAGVSATDPLQVLTAAATLTSRVVNNLMERQLWGAAFDDLPEVQLADAADGAYIMRMAWPAYRLEANAAAGVRLTAGEMFADAAPVQDISGEVVRDFEATRRVVMARAIGRGLVKYITAQAIERQAEQRAPAGLGFLAGALVGAATNAAGNALERADTRSWSLLPDRIAMARLSLPAGEHELRVQVRDDLGEVVETVDLGTVRVEPGARVVLNRRVWGGQAGDRQRLASAVSGVSYADVTDEPGAAPTRMASSTQTQPQPQPQPQTQTQAQTQAQPRAATSAPAAPAEQAQAAPRSTASSTAAATQQSAHAVAAAAAEMPIQSTSHTLSITPMPMGMPGGSLDWLFTRGRHGIGLTASGYTWDEDVAIASLAMRARLHLSQSAPGGLNFSTSVGAAAVCDFYCTYGEAAEQFGILTGGELGYALPLGNLLIGVGVGAQFIMPLTEAAEDGYGMGYSEEMYITPTGGLSIGWIFR